jgi:LmbE family N-acetylglucosaminyl deacetylase
MTGKSAREETNEALVRRLKTQPVVVLSPHFDDACLSLGGLLNAVGGGTLINVFTRSLWLVQSEHEKPTEQQVRIIRDAEDAAFARHCGLARHDLGGSEPATLGRRPLDLSHLEEDVADRAPSLLGKLDELARPERSFLLCPMGIGRHVNHRATFEILLRNFARIGKSYTLFFYEDLPYAANFYRRLGGIRRMRQRLRGGPLRRHVFVPDWAAKEALIGFYPSQFPPPLRRQRFRPAAVWPFVPHEAFWSVDRDSPL